MNTKQQHYRLKYFSALLMLIVSVWGASSVIERVKLERKNKAVEICVDWDEVVELCYNNSYPLETFLERCRTIGVQSAALSEDTLGTLASSGKIIIFKDDDYTRFKILDLLPPGTMVNQNTMMIKDSVLAARIIRQLRDRYNISSSTFIAGAYTVVNPKFQSRFYPGIFGDGLPVGFSEEKIAFLSSFGLKAVLKLVNTGSPSALSQYSDSNISGVFWEGKDITGYPGNETLAATTLKGLGTKFINIEFSNIKGLNRLENNAPELLVRGHNIPVPELIKFDDHSFWVSRWMRGAKDRNNRFFLFNFCPQKTIEDNFTYLRHLGKKLRLSGYTLAESEPPSYPKRDNRGLWLVLAILAAIFIPPAALYQGKQTDNPLLSYIWVNLLTAAVGILISALLFDVFFMQKIAAVPAIKLALLVPMALSVFIAFPPEMIKRYWSLQLKIKHVVYASALLLAAFILILRSGNGSSAWWPEQYCRNFLENLLAVRPRTKEFLIGQPLLFLGFKLKIPALVWLGMISQVSIINTFLHVHSPITVSLIRTFHGMWLGLLIGYTAYAVIEYFKGRQK